MNLPNGERTTASDVVNELSRGELSQELQGRRAKLIFSGRVLSSSDCIHSIVPFGGVVHCAILNDAEQNLTSDIEEGSQLEREDDILRLAVNEGNTVPINRRRARDQRNDFSDFVWGFMLGYIVGPLMCFWLLESAPKLQKIGIFTGCCLRVLTSEYHYLMELNVEKETTETSRNMAEKTSFDIVTSGAII